MESELVSIEVATYNSAEFVLETLESIKCQTYPALELIVSDDCSTDGTLSLVEEWLSENKNRFAHTQLITVPANTGVSANCNRLTNAATSNWIKMIAGDDILLPDCIADNIDFIRKHPESQVVFSQVRLYRGVFKEESFVRTMPGNFPDNLMQKGYKAEDQFKLLLVSDRINYTPTYFYNKKAVVDVGGYDESFTRIEDYPMWLKLTRAGYKLSYFHKETVGYRMHNKALNNRDEQLLIKPQYFTLHKIRKQVAHPFLPWEMVASENFTYHVSKMFYRLGWNSESVGLKRFYHLLVYYANPFYYIYVAKKRLVKDGSKQYFYK